MSDRRETPSNGRVAHVSLKGMVTAERFTEGTRRRVALPVAPLYDSITPGGWNRDRELVLHQPFRVLEDGDGWAFGFAERDGYVGYVRAEALVADIGPMTHVVAARQSYLTAQPRLKHADDIEPISFATELSVGATHEDGRWSEVTRARTDGHAWKTTHAVYVPTAHLRPLDRPEDDPVAVAMRFLGTPYHWGGNSGFGIDCSGLVQAACLACGIPCPGDSDQQAARLGDAIADDAPVRRGDLYFWKGHVAMAVDDRTLIHANAHHMAVVVEPLAEALERIASREGQPTLRRRLPH
jgi:cell wall-associated NlpC family hydrolase